MATAPTLSIYMKSTDLIKKEPLDYGGFGEVYLCYHKTLGQVVLKKVYTGPPRNEGHKQSLLEEGSLMNRLSHERVVKLLGVIMEDGDYSLVMELIPKGNLLTMLERVSVPISVKGRIILEILEGMVYLTQNHVIHKDLKPENILVDGNFHIKIADLGLATCQTWSKLTKDESRRQSRLGRKTCVRAAGTLCYMAPEHLDSIHHRSTEKSDIYSFAIVVWVILTGTEPYENARSEDHICQCVRQGQRPDEELIPDETPEEIITLMKRCWNQEPQQRPTFAESYGTFLHFYKDKLERDVEKDSHGLMAEYEGPEELLEKMKSLTMGRPSLTADSPAPLRSSELSPIEASIEDLDHFLPSETSIQSDACPVEPGRVEQKLARELDYHKNGSYSHLDQTDHTPFSPPQQAARRPGDLPFQVSSVQSWGKADAALVTPEDEPRFQSMATGPFEGLYRPEFRSQLSSPYSQAQYPPYDRHQSWPTAQPVTELAMSHFTSPGMGPDPGGLFIQNASGIQIGHNNTLSIRTPADNSLSNGPTSTAKCRIEELLHKYEDHAVTEAHLEVLRVNIGSNWKKCARKLGLTEVEVETIEHDYERDGLGEKVHQTLERWRMKEGYVGCTVGNLYKALASCVKVDLLCQLLLKTREAKSP